MWNERHLISGGPMVPLETTAPPVPAVHTVQCRDETSTRSSEEVGFTVGSEAPTLRERLLPPPLANQGP